MRPFSASLYLVACLFTLPDFGAAAPGYTNSNGTLSCSGTWNTSSLPLSSAHTASSTITVVSYVTVSNGTSSSAASPSPTPPPNPCSINPNSYDCHNPNVPPGWESQFGDMFNPYNNGNGYYPPYSGPPDITEDQDTVLSTYCQSYWSSTYFDWLPTAEAQSHFSHAVSVYYSEPSPIWWDWRDFGPKTLVPYTASPPCCSACTLSFGDVQVYDWPPAPRPPLNPTLVNTNNFSFVYPTVYVAFNTLAATDLCGEVGTAVTSATTMAFHRRDLSTMNSYWRDEKKYSKWWATGLDFTYTALEPVIGTACFNITTTLFGYPMLLTFDAVSQAPETATDWPTYIDGIWTEVVHTYIETAVPVTYNPCYPFLSIPSKIFTLSPEWSGCVKYMTGLRDPPIYISTGAGFSPITHHTHASHSTANPNGPSPAPIFQPLTATKTTAAGQQPTAGPTEKTSPPTQPQPPLITKLPVVVTMPGTSFTLDSNSALVINSQTVTRGGKITISGGQFSGKTIYMGDNGRVLDIDGTTQHLDPTYLVGTQPITAGGAAVNVAGKTYSLASGASSIVIDGSTMPIDQATRGAILQQVSAPAYVMGGQTLVAGGTAITSAGTVLSLESDGKSVVIGGSRTVDISQMTGAVLQQVSAPAYIVDGQTLVAGGTAVTLAGTVLSLEPGGESVVIGGSTTVDISQLTGASSLVVTSSEVSSARASGNYDGLRSTHISSSVGATHGAKRSGARGTFVLDYPKVWLGVLFVFIRFGAF